MRHEIELELLRSPRLLKRRPGTKAGWGYWTDGVAITWAVISLFISLIALHLLATIFFGVTVPAKVTSLTNRGNDSSYSASVSYEFAVSGRTFEGKSQISYEDCLKLSLGSRIPVRVLAAMPVTNTLPFLPGGSGYIALVSIPYALFFNGAMIFGFRVFYWPLVVSKRLVKCGIPTAGAIQHKEIQNARQPRYVIRYGYVVDPDSLPRTHQLVAGGAPLYPLRGEMYVTKSQYDSVNPQDRVTVLFNPDNPQHSIVYTLARHIAV